MQHIAWKVPSAVHYYMPNLNKRGNYAMANALRNIPVEEGKEYSLEIVDLGHSGEGVGRIDGFAVFVPRAIPGDIAKVEIEQVKKKYARGRLLYIERPSVHRIAPPCSVSHECGGCQLQAMEYTAQLSWKRQRVEDNLQRIGKIQDVEVLPVIGMEHPYRYRNKSQYPVGTRDGKIVMGFYKQGTHDIVESLSGCLIDHPLNSKAIQAVKELFNELKVSVYDENTGEGLFRHVMVRTSVSRGKVMVVFVTNGEEIPEVEQLISGLRSQVPEVVSIQQNINTRRGNVILGERTRLLWGEPVIRDKIGHLEFEISPRSFFQVNPVQTKVLYDLAKEYAELTGTELVVDAYCGIGTIALYVADEAEQVIGIEDVPEAIEDARRNSRLNGIENATFYTDKVENLLPQLVEEGLRPDVVILDPPRKGAEPEVLQAIAAAEVPRVVYVSCNPSSLARDLSLLQSLGYGAKKVQPVDMFPHTSHVETIALMSTVVS